MGFGLRIDGGSVVCLGDTLDHLIHTTVDRTTPTQAHWLTDHVASSRHLSDCTVAYIGHGAYKLQPVADWGGWLRVKHLRQSTAQTEHPTVKPGIQIDDHD
jgi:hypothetical protein